MEAIGAYEAKTHLPRLLDEVAAGRSYTITKHGVPVAQLVPARRFDAHPEDIIRDLREMRRGITAEGSGIRDMIEDGRR